MQQPPHQQPPQMSEEQRQARLQQMKRQWDQKRAIKSALGRIKTKVGVYSGKGGVGKTTVAVNLAVYLAKQGYRVGLFDVDIDCPNAARAIGALERPHVHDGRLEPVQAFGVKVLSMSFFQQKEDEAIIFRGPMIHNSIMQFLETTDWGDLDFLVLDLPPGTSDAALTVMQALDMDGFVVVTTPQSLAALDAKRSIHMIQKLNVNVFGIVENMTGEMFGTGAGASLAADLDLPFLGKLAMRKEYRQEGKPTVLASADVSREYDGVWNVLKARLQALQAMPEQQQVPEPAP